MQQSYIIHTFTQIHIHISRLITQTNTHLGQSIPQLHPKPVSRCLRSTQCISTYTYLYTQIMTQTNNTPATEHSPPASTSLSLAASEVLNAFFFYIHILIHTNHDSNKQHTCDKAFLSCIHSLSLAASEVLNASPSLTSL